MTNKSTEVVKRDLPVELNAAEKLDFGEKMADAELSIAALKKEMEPLKAAVKDHAAERARLAECIDSGTEERQVNCKWIETIEENVTRLIRQDTGDVVEERALSAEEREQSLDFGGDTNGDDAQPN